MVNHLKCVVNHHLNSVLNHVKCGESPTDLVHAVVLLEEHEGGLGGEVVGLVPVPQVFTDHLTERLPVAAAH